MVELDKETSLEEMEVPPEGELTSKEKRRQDLCNDLLDHISLSKVAHFKSQQLGEPDLSREQKREIAESILNRSYSLFLSRFGTHLLERHLEYFVESSTEERYEVEYYLKTLRKNHCKPVSKVQIKNRRFEALKKLITEGSYFSEEEMRKRNPLLYEHLIGQFLTEEEKHDREYDYTEKTFVNILMEQIDRDQEAKLKHKQQEAEDDQMEEEDSSSGEEGEDDDKHSEHSSGSEEEKHNSKMWGEYMDSKAKQKEKSVKEGQNAVNITDTEKRLLMEEFQSNMFISFLQGKDKHFDYSEIDNNSEYDDLEVVGQDEEDKYFGEESPEDARSVRSNMETSEEEDGLDTYMRNLQPDPTPSDLADTMVHMNGTSVLGESD